MLSGNLRQAVSVTVTVIEIVTAAALAAEASTQLELVCSPGQTSDWVARLVSRRQTEERKDI